MWKFLKIREDTYHALDDLRKELSANLKKGKHKNSRVSFDKAIKSLLKIKEESK